MPSILFSATEGEKAALSHFCQSYVQGSFWPLEEFYLSLRIPQTFLIYDPEHDALWKSLALGRVMGGDAELFFITTRPDLRGQGLAQALLADFEEYAKAVYRARTVMLEVRVSNTSAIRLYEKAGYQRQGLRRRYYQDGEDALVYGKDLVPAP